MHPSSILPSWTQQLAFPYQPLSLEQQMVVPEGRGKGVRDNAGELKLGGDLPGADLAHDILSLLLV